jgi:hypothetical protein
VEWRIRAVVPAGISVAVLCLSGVAVGARTSAPTSGVVHIDVDFTWDGTHNCVTQRTGSVACISGKATVPSLGEVQYARDAVPAGATTPDGCAEFSTHGTIWLAGGTADFDGTPVATCGGTDSPDAHYTYTISNGTGILAGASGTGDIVADNGVDRWHGTLEAPGLAPHAAAAATVPHRSHGWTAATTTVVALAVAVVAGALALGTVVGLRRKRARSAG